MRCIYPKYMVVVGTWIAACGTPTTPREPPFTRPPLSTRTANKAVAAVPAARQTQMESTPLPFANVVWNDAPTVTRTCAHHLAHARTIQRRLRQRAHKAPTSATETSDSLALFNDLLIDLDRIQPRAELMANVHPQKEVRNAAETCERQAKKFVTQLMLDQAVYRAIVAVSEKKLDALAKRFRRHLIRDYRRSGVDRDKKTRTKLAKLNAEMVRVGQAFDRNIREDKRYLDVLPKDLEGMPQDFLATHKPNTSGKIRITTDYPDFFPVQSYARKESLRRDLYLLFLTRAYPANHKNLKRLLALRHAYARALGYTDWASYNAEDKMVKTKQVIASFIDRIAKLARPRMQADLRAVLKRKRKDNAIAPYVGAWDRFYYVQKIQAERYGVDPAEVRAYFEFHRVKKGILDLAQQLFGVTFRQVHTMVWHPSVDVFDVYREKKLIARFFLDLHPRPGKFSHAAEFTVLSGVKDRQLPVAALATNFPDPSKSARGPTLMEHGQVSTFFHEFGHLMHQLLSGNKTWVSQSGITCEWDFVEAPSQLLEEWIWDAKVLAPFAKHYKTGKSIPEALVARMRKAKEFGKGMHVMRQMFYAALSLAYHSRDPKRLNLFNVLKRTQRRYNPYPYQRGSTVFANFGHLNGYSSMYYTYMWSLVLAKDLFTRFEKEGLLNTQVAADYRAAVLAPGGTRDAVDLVKTFLGRKHSFEAYKRWLAR